MELAIFKALQKSGLGFRRFDNTEVYLNLLFLRIKKGTNKVL